MISMEDRETGGLLLDVCMLLNPVRFVTNVIRVQSSENSHPSNCNRTSLLFFLIIWWKKPWILEQLEQRQENVRTSVVHMISVQLSSTLIVKNTFPEFFTSVSKIKFNTTANLFVTLYFMEPPRAFDLIFNTFETLILIKTRRKRQESKSSWWWVGSCWRTVSLFTWNYTWCYLT